MRKGYIKCSDILIKEMWQDVYVFFKDFRPTHIEFRHWENDVWYFYGVSELFDELTEGEVLPQYDVTFTRHNDGSITYKFERLQSKIASSIITIPFI
jgi:hypothetical protein